MSTRASLIDDDMVASPTLAHTFFPRERLDCLRARLDRVGRGALTRAVVVSFAWPCSSALGLLCRGCGLPQKERHFQAEARLRPAQTIQRGVMVMLGSSVMSGGVCWWFFAPLPIGFSPIDSAERATRSNSGRRCRRPLVSLPLPLIGGLLVATLWMRRIIQLHPRRLPPHAFKYFKDSCRPGVADPWVRRYRIGVERGLKTCARILECGLIVGRKRFVRCWAPACWCVQVAGVESGRFGLGQSA